MSDVIKTKKAVIREHRVALERKIGMLRRGAKASLKKQVADLEVMQYARLGQATPDTNVEELYHDIETKIKEGTEDINKNGPGRIESAIQKLRVDNLMSCQAAINDIDKQTAIRAEEKAREAKAKAEINAKSNRVSQPV